MSALDISAPLLREPRARGEGIENLRFERPTPRPSRSPAPFDVVFSRFGVMFFADPVAAFRNLRGALRPAGGSGSSAGGRCREPLVHGAARRRAPALPSPPQPPSPGAPGPFAFADGERFRTILAEAGFADIEVTGHDAMMVIGGDDFEEAVNMGVQLGPLGHALSGAPGELREAVRAAVREAFAERRGPQGVSLAAAVWLVRARRES